MGKFEKIIRYISSDAVVGIILGFLLGLFAELMTYFIDASMRFCVMLILIIPIFILLAYLSGFFRFGIEKYHKWKRFRNPIQVGVLKEFLDDPEKGVKCKKNFLSVNDWIDKLSKVVSDGKNVFDVNDIYWSKISTKYAVIVNPFGEFYLEKNKRQFSTFEKIRDYISNGGIFCCTGGFPFYYYWNELTGLPVDTTPKTRWVTTKGLSDTRFFSDSLVTTTFGALINNIPNKPTPIKVFQQNDLDKKFFGDLVNVGGSDKVYEFRSLSEGTRGLIPGLRVKHGDSEKYPLAGISYGDGYLVIAGMDLQTDVEFLKLFNGLVKFANEIAKRHLKK